MGAAPIIFGLCVPLAWAQDRDRDHDRDRDRTTRIEPGTTIAVRTNEAIDVERRDERVFRGAVEQDVRGENGRLAIPRGSGVELKVRVAPDNDLILDLESVSVNGQRYAVGADANRVESRRDNSLVGSIVGAIQGGEVRGRVVRVPRDTVLTFRIDRPMVMGVVVGGYDRDRDGDRNGDRDRGGVTRIEPGTTIAVRTTESIDVDRRDERVYRGMVDQDVRGENGRLAIPRGSGVELMVRVAPDNDLILDLEAVSVNGQRYAVKADANRVESRRDNSLVGAVVGAIQGGDVRGRAVRVPRDSVLTFRIDRPMTLGAVRGGY